MKQNILPGAWLLLPLFIFGGCGGPKTWKIGVMARGDFFYSGILVDNAATLAVQEFTEQYGKIGGCEIQLDSQGYPERLQNCQGRGQKIDRRRSGSCDHRPVALSCGGSVAGYVQKSQTPMIIVATNPVVTK